MNKKISILVLSLASLLFFSCDLGQILVADIDGIRDSIKVTYEFTDTGSTYSWSQPKHLDSHAKRFFISENSASKSTSSMTCKIVATQYQASNYYDQVSIKKTCSSVDFNARFTETLYLWVEIEEGEYYNLGEFTSTTTETIRIKQNIVLNVDNKDPEHSKFQWAIPDNIAINPQRFIISPESVSHYSSDKEFSCLIVELSDRELYYEDTVSIKRNIYTVENNYKVYDVVAQAKLTSENVTEDYYLWIQIEEGDWYNLGKFKVK